MDPQEFYKVCISALGIRVPLGIHAVSIPYYCEITLPRFTSQLCPVPLITPTSPEPDPRNLAAVFYLKKTDITKLFQAGCGKSPTQALKFRIYTARQRQCCGIRGDLLGKFGIAVESEWVNGNPIQVYDAWTSIGNIPGAEFHVNVRVEPDPRFVFQFDGDTASSPQIMQIHNSLRQSIFSCKFSRDRSSRARLGFTDAPANGERDKKERKGWLVMIHDLSGSPVAAASIATPFVPFSGSDYVSKSNPGAWLILRPDPTVVDSWEPWGRLEAWRDKAGLGLRFQLVAEGGGITSVGSGVLVSETVISPSKGGEFTIDTVRFRTEVGSSSSESPISSRDSMGFLGMPVAGGFVMSCPVHGTRRCRGNNSIQMAVRHVTCVEDAAVFLALAAAVDLSVDACLPFSCKLRKELCQNVE